MSIVFGKCTLSSHCLLIFLLSIKSKKKFIILLVCVKKNPWFAHINALICTIKFKCNNNKWKRCLIFVMVKNVFHPYSLSNRFFALVQYKKNNNNWFVFSFFHSHHFTSYCLSSPCKHRQPDFLLKTSYSKSEQRWTMTRHSPSLIQTCVPHVPKWTTYRMVYFFQRYCYTVSTWVQISHVDIVTRERELMKVGFKKRENIYITSEIFVPRLLFSLSFVYFFYHFT